MILKSKIKAVLFDFDGVICQTEVNRMDQMEARLKELGLQVDPRRLYTMIGGGPENKETQMDRIFGDQPRYWENREKALLFKKQPPEYSRLLTQGLPEVLCLLKEAGIKSCIASNSQTKTIETALDDCKIRSMIWQIISGWDLERKKPDPYIYLLALEKLQITAQECVVVEDSAVGIRAGRSAGIYTVALKDRDGWIDQSESDCIIKTMAELPALLNRL